MNSDEHLARVRMLAANTHASHPVSGLHHDLARAVQALDEHLTGGNPPPTAWADGDAEHTQWHPCEVELADERPKPTTLTDNARKVLDVLDDRGASPEMIAERGGLTTLEVLRVLPALELAGFAVWAGTGWRLPADTANPAVPVPGAAWDPTARTWKCVRCTATITAHPGLVACDRVPGQPATEPEEARA